MSQRIFLGLSLIIFSLGFVSFYLIPEDFYAMLALFACIALSFVVFFSLTYQGKRFFVFLKETKIELLKVFWPDRSDLLKTTLLVFVVVAIFAFLLWVMDSIFSWVISMLLI